MDTLLNDDAPTDNPLGKALGGVGVYFIVKYVAPFLSMHLGIPLEMAMGVGVALGHTLKSFLKQKSPAVLAQYL